MSEGKQPKGASNPFERSGGSRPALAAALGLLALVGVLFAFGLNGDGEGEIGARLLLDGKDGGPVGLAAETSNGTQVVVVSKGRDQEALVRLINRSGQPLAVGLAARPDGSDLDGSVWARVKIQGKLLADGPIEGIHDGTPGTVILPPRRVIVARLGLRLDRVLAPGPLDRPVRLTLRPIARPVR